MQADMEKKKKIIILFFIVVIVVGVSFLLVKTIVQIISGDSKSPELLNGAEQYSFQELLQKEEFTHTGKVSVHQSRDENTYYFEEEQADAIADILGQFTYYAIAENGAAMLTNIQDYISESLYDINIGEREDGSHLAIHFSQTTLEGYCYAMIVLEDSNDFSIGSSFYDTKIKNGMLVSDVIAKKINQQMDEIKSADLSEIRSILADAKEPLSVYSLLGYRHTYVETVNNVKTGDFYISYKIGLDNGEYLLVKVLDLGVQGEINQKYLYIFEVDYDTKDGTVVEKLYDNEKRYLEDLEIERGTGDGEN